MRNLDKSTRLKEFAKKDNLPLEVLQVDVTDDKTVTDAIVYDKCVYVYVYNIG